MSKCEDCNEPYDATKHSRVKCNSSRCQKWSHKTCVNKMQIDMNGYWYCDSHKIEIPLELRRKEISDSESETTGRENQNTENKESEEKNSMVNTNDEDATMKLNLKIPFDNGDMSNPFANFNCETCDGSFTNNAEGVLCKECRNTYHVSCLEEIELESVRNSKFVCQHCIQNKIRLKNLREKHLEQKRIQKKVHKANNLSVIPSLNTPNFKSISKASTPKSNSKSLRKNKDVICISSSSSSISYESCDDEVNEKILQYKELKDYFRKRRSLSKNLNLSNSSSEDSDSETEEIPKDPMLYLYKFTQEEREKARYENLPEVEAADTKWSVFYELFKNSRKLFSDSENVLRIQKSIKSKEILEIGGVSLFNPKTYWQAIKLINKRLNQSFNLIQKESHEIIKLKKIRYDQDHKKIIEFINKIINYNFIIENYGSRKHKTDERIISHIGNIMPNSLMNGWHKLKAKLESKKKSVYISHIADYLSKQVAFINSKMQAEETDPWKETLPPKPFRKTDYNFKRNYNSTNFRKTDNSQNHSNPNSHYCWLHKSKGHSAFNCSKLWDMSGKEVSDLARKNDICTFCGLKKHKDCPAAKTLNCKIENCRYKHHILFCYRRKGKSSPMNNNRTDNSKNSHSSKGIINKNNENFNRSTRFLKKIEKTNHHDDDIDTQNSSDSEIEIPQSNFYINKVPKTMKIKSLHSHSLNNVNLNLKFSRNYHLRSEFLDNVSHNIKLNRKSSCFLGIIVVNFIEFNKKLAFLLDSGSTVSLIEESVANSLEIKGIWNPLRLNWSSNMSRVDYASRIIKANVTSTYNSIKKYEIYFRTVSNLNMHDQHFDKKEIKDLFPHLSQLQLNSYSKISGIIGIDNLWCFDQYKVIKPKDWTPDIPYGIKSPLGDYVIGNLNQLKDIYIHLKENESPCDDNLQNNTHNDLISEQEELELEKIEDKLMGLEYKFFDSNDKDIFEEKLALELLNKHVRKAENNINYEAPLLWRDENVTLPTEQSFKIAFRRLLIVEKNSIKNNRYDECIEQVETLLRKNYAEIVPPEEINKKDNKIFYLPTFFIQPKNKRTRFIWDAATKVDGKSLNDYLLSGPNLYTNYLEIMFRMQEGKFLIKGDVQEMFHQIWMRKEDRDSLRFLFRKSPEDKLKILRMRVMIFGSKCSPTTSQYVKNIIAQEHISSHPDAADVILHSTYVDDVITSTDDVNYAKSLIKDIRYILKSGGFNLVKLNSNEKEIINHIQNHLTEDDLKNEKLFSKDNEEKLLGYSIKFDTDQIAISPTFEKIPENILNCKIKPNKKQVLQLMMSIFDPLGFVEFVLAKFKLFYHWLIKNKYEWSQIIDDSLFTTWKNCIKWLKDIQDIQIPRLYSVELINAKTVQLVGFGDAGIEMLCAVIYIRLLDENRNQIGYRFICAKSFTVPLKQKRTIPELEIDIACKLVNLMIKVEKFHKIKFHEKLYFTDNYAVQGWVVNDAKNPKIYIKNRLEKIKNNTKANEWHWVPTDLQPADFGTKINSMPTISYNNEWFAPKLFSMPEDNWPKIANTDTVMSHDISNSLEESDSENSFIENFSSFDRLIKITMKACEWKSRIEIMKLNKIIKSIQSDEIRTRKDKREKEIKIEKLIQEKNQLHDNITKEIHNYSNIESKLIRIAQKESFKKEYETIKAKKPLLKSNYLYKLLPYIDNDGILRAQTRITNNESNRQNFSLDRINPIILPRKSHLTKLIILKYHQAQAHHNEKTVVINLLSRFHINKIKRTVNNLIREECMICKKSRARPAIPLMGDIPSYKLATHLPAFSYVIVDLLGPIQVKASKFKTNKRYVLVYSCLTTRALHLELIESLESHATLRALQNTFNLRGVPIRICSDNGTNFKGSSNIIKESHAKWNEELLKRGAIIQPIEWDFSPAKAPHMNGSVERMVGLVKNALKNIKNYMDMKHSLYDDYGLKCVLCEIINMINSRPIEIMPSCDDQHTFLTPNFFIMGRQNAQSIPPRSDLPKTFTQQWNDIKIITNILWEKWLKAYFPIMKEREKWIDKSTPLELNDLILTADPTIANSWRVGVITDVTMGSQQQVRQVTIRLGKNKSIDPNNIHSHDRLLKAYRDEIDTIITRPAIAVAKINMKK